MAARSKGALQSALWHLKRHQTARWQDATISTACAAAAAAAQSGGGCGSSGSKAPPAAAAAGAGAAGGVGLGKRLGLAGVRHIVAIASGKGGVGKSTVAANVAVALATRHRLRVGLLDADVHGPSVPTLLGLEGEPLSTPEGLLVPQENFNVKAMSMGFFTEGDAPIVWRGPMATKALDRLLVGTAWGDLDVLLVDMPPGTGDAQISLGQRLPLSGAVVVSTPQDVALLDARRGARMFAAVRVPLLGLVDNMAGHACSKCGHVDAVFGAGGVQRAAEELGAEVLGSVPLEAPVASHSDEGVPIVVASPDSPAARALIGIAGRVWARLQELDAARGGSGSGDGGTSGGGGGGDSGGMPTITVS